ncbi:MAG TPA: zinc ribbon domain-containing protein [Methylomirabilota bacterium]|nr:zinc ribbon domain-containing protein [Methylomirabilota bacterium]
MSEVTAQKKFHCPACGGEAVWTPARQALVCGYCGTVSPAQVELTSAGEEVIREHDLVTALRGIPDEQRGWQARKTSVRCQSCEAISVFDPERVGQRCDFCGSASLVPYEEIKESFRPESLLPMKWSESQVREAIRQWYSSRFWAPNRLKTRAATDVVRGLYIPYWTFDAQVRADWTAESGDYYYDTEYYTDAQGRRQSRQVRKVRWYPSSGRVEHFFNDELVPASRGVHPRLLSGIEPFPTGELVPYQAGYLAGWVVERYQIDLVAAAQRAREQMDARVRQLCAAQVPGDTHRNLRVWPDYSRQTFKHILVPLWLLTYRYRHRTYQVAINGCTGAIAGEYPRSWVKIALAVLLVAAVAAVLTWLANR